MIAIRHARKEDVPALAAIGLAAWGQAIAGVADLERLRDNAAEAFIRFLAASWPVVRVAEEGGEPLGWAARERGDDEITDLWVRPAAQKRGAGSALLAAMEAEVAAAGQPQVCLQTHARNRAAISFFTNRGYAVSWLSIAHSTKLDRDVESVGLRRMLVEDVASGYGPDGF
ncbi:GNAT family N-acetyltransferase [Ensifer soli]|uniref:GNAT family N-acetyltransferase n=1 Tax=Ciceribacter sp. sgz301302 TaxID=3342379 RepID=UPI0035BAE901